MRGILFAILALSLVSTTFAFESCVRDRVGGQQIDIESCVSKGYWAEIKRVDDCHFTFTAGLSPAAESNPNAQPTKFSVSGGRCERWPNRPLNAGGTTVPCARSGNGSATLTLETPEGVLRKVLKPVPTRGVPEEPILEKHRSSPLIEVFTLYRSRDFHQIAFGRACPTCRLLAADVRPSEPGATILEVAVVSTAPSSHWFRCPAGWKCGVPEFSPPDEPQVSGCAQRHVCRIWRLSDDEGEAHDALQITYEADRSTCKNCPAGVDYPTARKRWEAAKDQVVRACEVLPDRPAQLFSPRPIR
jgi:hypothetical protein